MPKSILLPYQRRWVDDSARFKVGVWARQTGKSFSVAAETVEDAHLRKTTWVTMSAGERQALEWMRKAREWVEAYRIAIEDATETRDGGPEAILKTAEIELANGSRIIAIPANPDTARGYSANINLDEFAFHEDPDAIWRAVFPSITNPLKGELRLRVVSTPNGKGNKFAQLVDNPKWSVHRISIHDAVAQGLPADIEALREGLADPEGWAQEYEIQFLDQAAVLLPYDVIALCEAPEATEAIAAEYWNARGPWPVDLGIDFGRKRHLTVCWAAEAVADLAITKEVLCLHGVSTPDQVEILRPRIARARRVCLDYTGPGVGLGDYLVKTFGEWKPEAHRFGKIELVTMTNAIKCSIFGETRMAFDRRQVRIPISRAIREDLHSMHRVITPSGNVTYRAPLTDDGHADRATALALCLRARGQQPAGIVDASGIRVPEGRRIRRHRPRRLTG